MPDDRDVFVQDRSVLVSEVTRLHRELQLTWQENHRLKEKVSELRDEVARLDREATAWAEAALGKKGPLESIQVVPE